VKSIEPIHRGMTKSGVGAAGTVDVTVVVVDVTVVVVDVGDTLHITYCHITEYTALDTPTRACNIITVVNFSPS